MNREDGFASRGKSHCKRPIMTATPPKTDPTMVPISPVLSPPPPPPKLPVALVGLSVLVGLEVDLMSLFVSIALDVVVKGGTFEVELNPPTLEREDIDPERH